MRLPCAELLQLKVEIGVGEPTRSPVLMHDDVTGLRLEVIVECAAPRVLGKGLPLGRTELVRGGVAPCPIIPRFPAMVGHEVDPVAFVAGDTCERLQMVEQLYLFG